MRPRALMIAALAGMLAPLRSLVERPPPKIDSRPRARIKQRRIALQPERYGPLFAGKSGHHNGARETARRRRQMERGDVLNWYPGQVRANWYWRNAGFTKAEQRAATAGSHLT